MPNLSCGVDLIETNRIQRSIQRHGERFLKRVYTPQELEQAGSNHASLAARFAAKEAVAKTLGTGIGQICWDEIEILRGPERQPILHLHGNAQRLAAERGLTTWSISLSHSNTHAIAMVVALGESE
ncbi:MAG: holo-ACP synthase [Anaerolineales bacterium]|jgi:holo-[acyl-carrier protein] synthase